MTIAEWTSLGSISRRTFVGGALVAASGVGAHAQTEGLTPKRGGILKVSTYLNPSRLDPLYRHILRSTRP